MSKFRSLSLLALLATLTLVSCQTPQGGSSKRSIYGDRPGPKAFSTVVIDAGHGGKDSGAKVRGLQEKTLVLDIAKKVKSQLRSDFKVVLTRNSDEFISLDDRVKISNRYADAVLVSIHLNYGPRRIAGPETYYWRTDSASLAKRLHRNLSKAAPFENGNRDLVRRRLRLTRNPQIPCVLVECGYLTHAKEAAQLNTDVYRTKLATAISKAIREQNHAGDSGMGPLPKPIYAPPSKAGDARDRF